MWCRNSPSLKRWVFMSLLAADLIHNIHDAHLCPVFWSTRLEIQTKPHPGRHSGDRVHTCAPMKRLFSESDLGINTVNRMSLRRAARWRGCACLTIWARACAFLCNGVGVIRQDRLAWGHFYTQLSSPLKGCWEKHVEMAPSCRPLTTDNMTQHSRRLWHTAYLAHGCISATQHETQPMRKDTLTVKLRCPKGQISTPLWHHIYSSYIIYISRNIVKMKAEGFT